MAQLDPVPQNFDAARSTSRRSPLEPTRPDRAAVPSKLKAQDLIALLTQHYDRARSRTRPKVATKLACFTPSGKAAVRIRFS